MISTYADLRDSCSFESAALAVGFPLVSHLQSREVLDLRKPNASQVIVSSIVKLSDSVCTPLINELRPLFIGAAWKILDLVFEYALNQAGVHPARGTRPTIDWKKQQAGAHLGRYRPLTNDRAIWERLTVIYANTVEQRHCLVHRAFRVNPDGVLSGMHDKAGASIPDITASQQVAFCKLAQYALWAGSVSSIDKRARKNIAWQMNQLSALHGKKHSLRGDKETPAVLIRVNAEPVATLWQINLAMIRDNARRTFPSAQYYDIEISFPESGLAPLLGRLEEAPASDMASIDPAHPPVWIFN